MASTNTRIQIGPYVVGEKPPPLVYTFLDSSGLAINLTGYAAKFTYRETDGSAVEASATVSAPTSGEVTYTWTGVEFLTSGHYQAEFWAGNGTNRYASLLLQFDVRQPVGAVPNV